MYRRPRLTTLIGSLIAAMLACDPSPQGETTPPVEPAERSLGEEGAAGSAGPRHTETAISVGAPAEPEAEVGVWPHDGPSTPSAEPPPMPPLYVGFTIHLEGWSLKTPEIFDIYVSQIRATSDLSHEYGAVFTWEAANLIKPSVVFDDNILHELQVVRGDGVGVLAVVGVLLVSGADGVGDEGRDALRWVENGGFGEFEGERGNGSSE